MREKYPYVEDVGLVISLIDGLVGVTSHITPLPMGEGQGGGAGRCRVWGLLVLRPLPLVYSIISPSARGTKKACHDHAADFQTNTLCF